MFQRTHRVVLEKDALLGFKRTHEKTKFVRPTPPAESIDYDTTDEMGDLLIPAFLQHAYLNDDPPVTVLRPWQHELLGTADWESRRNCAVVAPTSGGKTLVAEVAIGQLLERDPRAKAIYALPFVALAAEKCDCFHRRFPQYSVRPFFQNVGHDFLRGTIAVCTYEKAHGILNAAIKGRYDDKIKLVVIDEVHMIGDESRGVVCESLIMKLRLLRRPPRVLALTATLNESDANRLASCIGGFCFYSSQRSTELRHYISALDGTLFQFDCGNLTPILRQTSIPADRDFLLPMIRAVRGRSVIVFVNTRSDTRRIALFLARNLAARTDTAPLSALVHELSKCPAGADAALAECIRQGIAFHNAGLLLEERRVVEEGIRGGIISVVVATTTLSAGINIRSVSRVIIHSPYRRTGSKSLLMSGGQFAQMAGRSGRTDNIGGDVVIITRGDHEKNEIRDLLTKPLPSVVTSVCANHHVCSYVLQALSLGLVTDFFTLKRFLCSSFDLKDEVRTTQLVHDSIRFLAEKGMLENYVPTTLGDAVTAANLTVEEGLAFADAVRKIMKAVCLFDDVHLMFLCIPPETGISLPSFSREIWEKIFKRHSHVIQLITGKTAADLQRFIIRGLAGRIDLGKEEQITYEKIYAASLLAELINERSLTEVERVFEVDRGTIQALQSAAASYAGQGAKFAEAMGYQALSVALLTFLKRLSFGVRSELIDLMNMPSMRRDVARVLFNGGYKSAQEVSALSARELAAMMPHQEGGMTEADFEIVAKRIIEEADALTEHIAMLEQFEEESAWAKVMRFDDPS